MVSSDALRIHLDYSRWATSALLDSASALRADERGRDFGTAHKSVAGTLVHIYGADRIWLSRAQGSGPTAMPGPEFEDFEMLRPAWDAVQRGWGNWISALAEDDVRRVVSYHDLKGRAWRTPIWQLVLHVVNHATHHRGQAAGFLRTMGHAPPQLDLIAYYRSLGLTAAG